MPKNGLSISGNDRLARKFDKLGEVGKGRTLRRAAVSGMLPIINDAKRKAPKLSGNLARSLHVGGHEDLTPDASGIIDRSGAGVPDPEVTANSAAVYGGTDVVYAATQEFGRDTIPAQPFLRPAFDGKRKEAVKETGAALSDLIKAVL